MNKCALLKHMRHLGLNQGPVDLQSNARPLSYIPTKQSYALPLSYIVMSIAPNNTT